MLKWLAAVNLVVLLAIQLMFAYEHWEGMTDLLRWQADVIYRCESNKFKRPSWEKENKWNSQGQPGIPWRDVK